MSIRRALRRACGDFLVCYSVIVLYPSTSSPSFECARFVLLRVAQRVFLTKTGPLRHAVAHMHWHASIDLLVEAAELLAGSVPEFFRAAHVAVHHCGNRDFLEVSDFALNVNGQCDYLFRGLQALFWGRGVIEQLVPWRKLQVCFGYTLFYLLLLILAQWRLSVFCAMLCSSITMVMHICHATRAQHLFAQAGQANVYQEFPLCLDDQNPFFVSARSGLPSNHMNHHKSESTLFSPRDFHELWVRQSACSNHREIVHTHPHAQGRLPNWQHELDTLVTEGTWLFSGIEIDEVVWLFASGQVCRFHGRTHPLGSLPS